jgi:radical SAM superfamily enzyme YgiQ (UPF0313 family)
MQILLINPPDCGRSIPEERYGITSIKQIFRGEPLALEELAGGLTGHEVRIVDLKAAPGSLQDELDDFAPDLVGITGVTCEAPAMLQLARTAKETCNPVVVVGGIHVSSDPAYFNRRDVDYIVTGLGKRSFAMLADSLEQNKTSIPAIDGVAATNPGTPLKPAQIRSTVKDMVVERPPAYELVSRYRSRYVLEKLGINIGFVASAFGCPHSCSFCCIRKQTGGSYLVKPSDAVLRDIMLLADIPVIRLVDANTFGNVARAMELCRAIRKSGINKQFLADIRSDTVVRHPEMLRAWKDIGLRAVIIGFEEINDSGLQSMNKNNRAAINTEAISILHSLGITIVGDFILSPEYEEQDFDNLAEYLADNRVDLPMLTVMTPIPGTPLYREQKERIINHDLAYYTLTNAVLPTRLDEKKFYTLYSELLAASHAGAKL